MSISYVEGVALARILDISRFGAVKPVQKAARAEPLCGCANCRWQRKWREANLDTARQRVREAMRRARAEKALLSAPERANSTA